MPVLHYHLACVGSTIASAWEKLEDGSQAPFWLTADEQTQGRGRNRRVWNSPVGNLYSTYVFAPPKKLDRQLLPFAISLAVQATISWSLPSGSKGSVGLKWPNDVLADGAKLAGILVESRHERGVDLFAIGIGINVASAPTIPGRKTKALVQLGCRAGPAELFERLRLELDGALRSLEDDPKRTLADWSRLALGQGDPVTVELHGETLHGTFDHLAEDGALMLRQGSGVMRAIYAGDLFLHTP